MINKKAWREGRRGEGERRKKFLRIGEQFECLEVGEIFECLVGGPFPFSRFPLLPVSSSPSPLIPLLLFPHHLPVPWEAGDFSNLLLIYALCIPNMVCYVIMWRKEWGLSVKQRYAPDTSG